ncbi:rubredoxin [Cylindrospermum stagnale]
MNELASFQPTKEYSRGTAFEDIPEDWVCLVCDAKRDKFQLVEV